MNKIFDKLAGGYPSNAIDYAKKLFPLIKSIPIPNIGTHSTGVGIHPYMSDPYWAGLKDVPKYATLDEWKVDVAITLALGLNSLATVSSSTPLPSQKTVNDWFALSSLVDGGVNQVLSFFAVEAAFLYNQSDRAFEGFKGKLASGDVSSHLQAQYAELMETGQFYNPAMDSAIGIGNIDFSITKHSFWKDVKKTMDAYMQDSGSVAQPLPKGSPINPDSLPIPENAGGLAPSVPKVDLPKTQVDKLVELYIGFFGRAAENEGLEYWKKDLDNLLKSGLSEDDAFLAISDNFWLAALEYGSSSGYSANMSNFDFVAKVYSNVLGRPDALVNDREGIDYWTKDMSDHGYSKGQMVLMILNGAHYYNEQNPDDPISIYVNSLLNNRTDISLFFAQESISGGLEGHAAIRMGVDVINRIDQNKSSVNKVKNALNNDTLYNLPEIELVGTGTVPTFEDAFM